MVIRPPIATGIITLKSRLRKPLAISWYRPINKKEILPKRKQTESEISQLLFQAYVNSKPIKIQSRLLNKNGELFPDILCMVEGYKHNTIYLKLKDT